MAGLIDSYTGLITSQHQDKPRYMATVAALLKHSEDLFNVAIYVDDEFDVDLAEGVQLDRLGEIVGAKRMLPFKPWGDLPQRLPDTAYRALIKSKIAQNVWKGGIEDLEEIWLRLFGTKISIQDNQDMTIDVYIDGITDEMTRVLVYYGLLVPKPQSVRLNATLRVRHDNSYYTALAQSSFKHICIGPKVMEDTAIEVEVFMGTSQSSFKRVRIGPRAMGDTHITARVHTATALISTHRKVAIKYE